jgi:hypothetical protein
MGNLHYKMSDELYNYHMQHVRTCKEFLRYAFEKQYVGQGLDLDEQGLQQLVLAYLNLAELFVLPEGEKLYNKKNEDKENDGIIDLS